MNNTIDFGIDLGTTNSAIAVYENGEVIVFKNPRTLKETIPSVVAFKGDRILVGEKAAELLHKESGDVFGGFKRRMGSKDRFNVSSIAREVSPIELSSIVLKELKNFIQGPVIPDAVVITVPAAFDTNQSNATKEAGYAAGFKEVVLLQEPIAASLAYANRKKADLGDGKWIVFDFGGGTFDVALTGIIDDEMQILDHEGDNFLGGKDIDRAIVEQFVIPELERSGTFSSLASRMRNEDGSYHRLYNKLIYLCEEAKIALSGMEETEIEFDTVDESGKTIDLCLNFTRAILEKIAQPFIHHAIELVDALFLRNQLSKDEIKFILLVGGTTYIPAVRKALSESFGIDVNTSIDPTTAVVEGAAYFAGLRVKMSSRSAGVDSSDASNTALPFQIQTAYERLVRSNETALLIRMEGQLANQTIRITRIGGGYDSGAITVSPSLVLQLPLLPNAFNEFDLTIVDAVGDKVYVERIGINQGKFGIHGQPLPHPIGIEVDDAQTNSTYLEIIFKKNSILPVRRTLSKRVSETIHRGTQKTITINVYEGDIDSIPQANRRIGTIEIHGKDLNRDLVKGSDIELTIEVSESRDVKVAAYLVLTDQHFENTFSPSEVQFNATQILETTTYFKENLYRRRDESERQGRFEEAGQIHALLQDIVDFEKRLKELDDKDSTDEKYHLEVKAREMGKRIHQIFNASYLTKVIEEYYKVKGTFKFVLLDSVTKEADRAAYFEIISHDREMLQEGNIPLIKMKTAQIQAMMQRMSSSKPLTEQDLKMIYIHLKNKNYKNEGKAFDLIGKGDQALVHDDILSLNEVVHELDKLYSSESKGEDYFINRKTGLE